VERIELLQEVLGAMAAKGLLALLSGLSERERSILRSRFGLQGVEEESRQEVAESLGVSVERVRQLEPRTRQARGRGGRWRDRARVACVVVRLRPG
jgi:DNA-directed RNA polymerase sigma subunit (sigma70/sigma32)